MVTGGRGRLAALVAAHFRPTVPDLTLFSRRGGDGFHPRADLPASLVDGGVLLHLAWSTLPATSEKGAGAEWQMDLPELEKLLQLLAAQPAARRPHLVFFSSGGTVYGNAPGRPSVETDPLRPIGWYGRAKVAAEEMIAAHAARHDLSCTVLRISNPYGYPVPRERAQGLIPHAIRSALEGSPLTLWGDGHARKDFIFHTDFLSALDEVVKRRLPGIHNISSGESHSVHEIISLVEKHTGKKIPTTQIEAPAWDVQDSRLDNRRFVSLTGWRPKVTLDEGIARSIAVDPAI
ncbi:MAG: UDP-glucose 4-epimerase [Lacunisphaera sp.]|nr:UDP-glucose 4-epimerase [Lacunisphaera sp.]